MKVLGWRAWYDTGKVYSSKETAWEDLPGDGVLAVRLYFDQQAPDGTPLARVMLGGTGDYYFCAPGPQGPVYGCNNDQPEETGQRYPGASLKRGKWTDEATMFEQVNSVEYGLTAAVWTSDIKRALKAARRVQSGMVWVNGVGNHFKGTPYGGYKNSGVGKESCLSELLSYTEEKSIQIFL